jgi:hypothetical protein
LGRTQKNRRVVLLVDEPLVGHGSVRKVVWLDLLPCFLLHVLLAFFAIRRRLLVLLRRVALILISGFVRPGLLSLLCRASRFLVLLLLVGWAVLWFALLLLLVLWNFMSRERSKNFQSRPCRGTRTTVRRPPVNPRRTNFTEN